MSARRPDFFIAGAPKCGTTALAHWLDTHPDIFMSPRKEPHFFNHASMPATHTLAEYEALFGNAAPRHVAVGEASTHYLFSPEAVPAILEYAPQARFIVCLRNPLDMAPSLHAECLRQGWETERSFARAWRLLHERRRGRAVPRAVRGDPGRVCYGDYCLLGAQLQRLYEWVAPQRVLALLLDDLRADPGAAYRQALTFLGAADDHRQDFPVLNPRAHTRSLLLARLVRAGGQLRDTLGIRGDWGIAARLRAWNSAPQARTEVSPALRQEMAAFFADDIALLAQLLDRDLSHWLPGSAGKGRSSSIRVTPGG